MMVLPEATSTNAVALEAVSGARSSVGAAKADVDGLVVVADYQTAGRGRQGRVWSSPRGASVLCSVAVVIDDEAESASHVGGWLTLVAAVAACEAIRRATHVSPEIKWPNDLRVSGRKLGGILIESRAVGAQLAGAAARRAWVIGIGINCLQHEGHFPAELRESATSLELVSSHPIDRVEVARALVRSLDDWLAEPGRMGDEAAHAAWVRYAEPIGQRVRLQCGPHVHSGRTVAVDPWGGLIVQSDDGRREWFDPMLTTLL